MVVDELRKTSQPPVTPEISIFYMTLISFMVLFPLITNTNLRNATFYIPPLL